MTSPPFRPSREQQALLERVLAETVRFGRLSREDGADFTQSVHLELLERDYDLLRRFQGRSSLRTYLTVAIRRMLLDWRNQQYGRWRPSAAARALGSAAIRLETLIYRDGCPVLEAVGLAAAEGAASRETLEGLARELPVRGRRRHVSLDAASRLSAPDQPDAVEARERARERAGLRKALHGALQELSGEDRRLLRLRFQTGSTVRALAALVQVEPPVLYRRYDTLLKTLRTKLAVS